MRHSPTSSLPACLVMVAVGVCLGGGADSNRASAAGSWVSKASLPTAREHLGTVAVGGALYAIGGWGWSALGTVEVYNPATNDWVTRAAMPTPRESLGVAEINGVIYAVGGWNNVSLATVEAYDPSSNTWAAKASLSSPRSHVAVGAVNGVLYSVGGFDSGVVGTVEAYTPASNAWTKKASLGTPRDNLAVGVVNGILYAIGGAVGGGSPVGTVEAYDPATNSWVAKAPMPTPRSGLAVAVANGVIYAIGGMGATYLTTVEAYDPATDSWSAQPSLSTARAQLAASVVNGVVYAVGGWIGSSLATVEAFTAVTQVTPTITWANPSAVTQGTALSATQLNATATVGSTPVAGVFTYTPPIGTVLSAGTYRLSVSFTPTDTTLYTTASGNATLTVALPSIPAGSATVTSLWGGARHSIAMLSDGSVWTWGMNTYGKLGDGTTSVYTSGWATPTVDNDRHTPVRVHGVGNVGFFGPVSAIMGGESHNFALKADGTVWSWGWNSFGQLGDATNTDRATPVQVAALDSIVSLGGRGYHSLALRSDGTVWTWGYNAAGQLADGTTTDRNVPIKVQGVTGVLAVTGGYNYSLALMPDYTLRSWGGNTNGQLGNGSTTSSASPVVVTGLTNVAQVSGGWKHAAAVTFDGTVWTWGQNRNGQLGDGTTTDRTVPIHVAGLTSVIAVSAGDCHTAALRSDGTVWAWGCNNTVNGVGNYEVGDGTSIERHTPVQVSGLTNVIAIAARDYHNLALKSDGTLWAWGFNQNGQLGDGTIIDRSVPVQVQTLGASPIPPVVTTQPSSVSVTAGAAASFSAAASGTPTPTVRWQASANSGSSWADIASATSTTYSFTASGSDTGKQYRAVFTNSAGTATTNAATLTVTAPPIWTPTSGGAAAWGGTGDDSVNHVVVDGAGNVYAVGQFVGTVDFDPDPYQSTVRSSVNGTIDAFLVKFDSSGKFQWVRTWGGGPGGGGAFNGRDVAVGLGLDSQGNVYACGHFQYTVDFNPAGGGAVRTSNANSMNNAYLVTFAPDGTFRWVRTWGPPDGGMEGYSLSIDASDRIYVVGDFTGTGAYFNNPYAGTPSDWHANHPAAPGQPLFFDSYLTKYDANGNFIWAKTWGGEGYDDGPGVAVDSLGNVYVAGMYASKTIDFDPAGGGATSHPAADSGAVTDVFLSKFDSNGKFLWVRTWGGAGAIDSGETVAVDSSNNVYVGGRFECTNCDFNPGGTPDVRSSHGSADSFVVKYDPAGNFQWARTWGGTGGDAVGGLKADSAGGIWAAGVLSGTADLAPATTPITLTSHGGGDAFFAKLDAGGTVQLAYAVGGSLDDFGTRVAVADANSIYLAGSFKGTVDFAAGGASDIHVSNGGADAFLVKVSLAEAAPVITAQPAKVSAAVGAVVSFSAAASGTPTPVAQWQVSTTGGLAWTDISGATSTTYSVTVGASDGGKQFRAVFTNRSGTATTNAATLTVLGVPQAVPPFGAFDTPLDGAVGLGGSLAVTGWALDDVGVARVELWRDLVGGEPASHAYTTDPSHPAYGKVFIANPLFVTGSRPDVETAYAGFPQASRSGWGYLLLSWGLHGQGNGTYKLYAYAFDGDGNSTLLGSKTIAVDNAHATKPFGALDTPAYGDTVSGGFWNYGWALTPNATPTCSIANGQVFMAVDSGALLPVNYGDLRTDIAASFPGFSNGSGSGGAYYLDTTKLTNGMHSIGWLVNDSCGRSDGIGSRFFTVQNASGDATSDVAQGFSPVLTPGKARLAPGDPGLGAESPSRGLDDSVTAWDRQAPAWPAGVTVRHNLGEWSPVEPGDDGAYHVTLEQLGRIDVQLPAPSLSARESPARYSGAQLVRGQQRPLPLGSSFDVLSGLFSWQPAPGFLGRYELVFETPDAGGIRVRVVVVPDRERRPQ